MVADSDKYFLCLLLSTAIVAIGIFFEWPEVKHGIQEWWRSRPAKTSWLIHSASRSHLPLWSLIGFILVAVGVAAEGVFEGLVGLKDTKIRNFDKGVISDTELKAKGLENSTQQLKTDEAVAQRDAGNEKLERLKLQAQIQPRTISLDDRTGIADELKKFAPTFKGRQIKIDSQTGDAEGMLFALEIMDILQRTGISVDASGVGSLVWVHAVAMGVTITGPPRDKEFIRSLVSELNLKLDPALGTSAYGEWKPEYTEFRVMVGSKPILGLPREWLHQHP